MQNAKIPHLTPSGQNPKTHARSSARDGRAKREARSREDPGTQGTFSTSKSLPKAEVSFTLANGSSVRISGVTSQAGSRYVVLREGGNVAVVPYRLFHGSGNDASRAVADAGIVMVKDWGPTRTAVAGLKQWPRWWVSTSPGWNDLSFALCNGFTLSPENTSKPLRAFASLPEIIGKRGSFSAWRKTVAKPLGDHLFASFWMMMPFAAPLLRDTDRIDNIGFELSGRGGIGKSTLLALMSSCCGVSVGGEGFTYWQTCNTTINAIEETMHSYNDMLLLLDEAGSMQGASKTVDRALKLHNMVFRLASGRTKSRYGEPRVPMSRFIYALTTNRSLPSLLGETHAAEAEALTDRLLNVPLLDEREFGAFDHLPIGFDSMTDFVASLKRGSADHYGLAIRRYLKFLVKNRARDPDRIRRYVARRVAEFIERSGVDADNGSQKRVAEAFAIVAAGGLLAQKAGVLPRNYRPMEAALDCYGLHRDHGRLSRTFDDRLLALMRHPDTIDLDATDPATLTEAMLKACRCLIKTGMSGERFLLVPKTYRDRFLPGWNLYRREEDVAKRMVKYQQRDAKLQLLGLGVKVVCYRFDISELQI